MVADSRSVALHHTAGFSTPQQVIMVLFSLYCLIDKKGEYKKEAQSIVTHRLKRLYTALGTSHPENQYGTHYYTTIDIIALARTRYGEEFAAHLAKNYEPIDFGALTGAGTNTATLNALKEEADSSAPVLGYTVPFAFGNVLLTIWGTVLVNVM